MNRQANENDVMIAVFAKKDSGEILAGFTSHPAPHNVDKRVEKFRQIGSDGAIPRPALRFGEDKAKLLNYWKENEYTIFVKASNRDAVQVFPKA